MGLGNSVAMAMNKLKIGISVTYFPRDVVDINRIVIINRLFTNRALIMLANKQRCLTWTKPTKFNVTLIPILEIAVVRRRFVSNFYIFFGQYPRMRNNMVV